MRITRLAFIKCMKYLNACYSKDLDRQQLESWYEYFSDISYFTLYKAVKEITIESKFFPTAPQLKAKCKEVNKLYILSIIDKMKDSGYFKMGAYEELTDAHAERSYNKSLMWLEEGRFPEFLENDIKMFMKENKQIEQKDKKVLNDVQNM